MRAVRMGFSFIRKTASTGSSATGALVAAGSLQPQGTHPKLVISHVHNTWIIMAEVGHSEPAPTSAP